LHYGGGDTLKIDALYTLLPGNSDSALSSVQLSVESHLVCFAVERSRLNDGVAEAL